jgi:hypothetical protein
MIGVLGGPTESFWSLTRSRVCWKIALETRRLRTGFATNRQVPFPHPGRRALLRKLRQ